MSKRAIEVVGVLAAAAFLMPGLLQAGEVQVGGQGGTGSPPGDFCDQGDEDCTVEVDWNPSVPCPGVTSLGSLYDCIVGFPQPGQNPPPPPPTFEITVLNSPPPYGVQVVRLVPWDPTQTMEVGRLKIFENLDGIATTQVRVDAADRVVRILEITEGPDTVGSGSIIIELDDDIVEVEPPGQDLTVWRREFYSSNYLTALDLNVAILVWLYYEPGIDVQNDNGSFVISREGGFRRVLFNSTDQNVVTSDIGLLPKNDPLVQHLFNTGGGF